MSYLGMPIIVSDHALQDTDVRLFAASKNRSRRIRKKLIKRFGGEFRKEPAIYRTPQGLVAHTDMYARLMAETAVALRSDSSNPW